MSNIPRPATVKNVVDRGGVLGYNWCKRKKKPAPLGKGAGGTI